MDKAWDFGKYGLSVNPCITHEFIERHLDQMWWGKDGLSSNPCITLDFIEKHIDRDWCWGRWGLSLNPCITPEFVEKHMDKAWYWGAYGLSSNKFSEHPFKKAKHRKIEIKTFKESSPFIAELTRSISSYL